MRAGVRLDERREQIDAGAPEVRARGVDAEHHVEPLGFLVDRHEALIAQDVAAVRRQHRTGVAELAHRAAELLRRGLRVLDRQEGDRLQARAFLDELLVHEGVVRPAELHGPGPVLQKGHEEPERREEHGRFHAALVERSQPLVGGSGRVVELRDEPPVPAVGRHKREGELPIAVRRVHVLHELLGGLGHVAVGIEHRHRRFLHRGIASILMASCRSR